jgi:hypothetical protein
MSIEHVRQLLQRTSITHEVFWQEREKIVFMSAANQLFSTKAMFGAAFRRAFPVYERWEAHHILEFQDCQRLGLESRLPPYEDQICVLLPRAAHRERINGLLRHLLPVGSDFPRSAILPTYDLAYHMLGDYCGGGQVAIAQELNLIVKQLIKMPLSRRQAAF